MDTKQTAHGRMKRDQRATQDLDAEMQLFLQKLMDYLQALLADHDFGLCRTPEMQSPLLGQMHNGTFVPGGMFWLNKNAELNEWSLWLSVYLGDHQELTETYKAGQLDELLQWAEAWQATPSLRPMSRKLLMLVVHGLDQTLAHKTDHRHRAH